MNNFDEYFQYLKTRSWAGNLYRKFWLYPRLACHIKGRALDVGCGLGDMLRFRLETIGVDINPRLVEHCKSIGLEAYVMESDKLPFPDKIFDTVILDNVLEHLSSPNNLIYEIKRVLKFNGTIIIGVPGKCGWNADLDHKVYYDESKLTQLGDKFGLRHRIFFNTPFFNSDFLSKNLRQYCTYALFTLDDPHKKAT